MAEIKKIVYLDLLNRYDTNIKAWVDAEIDKLPVEQFLDSTSTNFVNSFTWSAETYPNTTNPSLDGKPVLVLALNTKTKNATTEAWEDSISYKFVSLNDLIDIYTGDTSDSTTVTITDNKVKVDVNISEDEDNCIEIRDDGLFVDTSDKANVLVEDILEDQVFIDDGNGDLKGSGIVIGGESIQVQMDEFNPTGINDTSLEKAWNDGSFTFSTDEWTEGESHATFSDKRIATEAGVMNAIPLVVKAMGFDVTVGTSTTGVANATTLVTRTNDEDGNSTGYSSSNYSIGTGTIAAVTEATDTTPATYSSSKVATEAGVMSEIAKVNDAIENVSNNLVYATESDISALFPA